MVDMIASNHISELSVPASARALLFRESSVGGVSYKAKKLHAHAYSLNYIIRILCFSYVYRDYKKTLRFIHKTKHFRVLRGRDFDVFRASL